MVDIVSELRYNSHMTNQKGNKMQVELGRTGAWIALGLRTDEFPVEIFSPIGSGSLDAPEMICAGGMQHLEGGGPKSGELLIIRGE